MSDMKSIILSHFKRYPKLLLSDIVKLIYQNEFAGGHFISSADDCLEYLSNEYKQVSLQDFNGQPPFEDIGNNLCRVHLNRDIECCNSILANAFIQTSNKHIGNSESFEQKLELITELCLSGDLPFIVSDVREYLTEYKLAGYPAVHHSEQYRLEYSPHYRVVNSCFAQYFSIIKRLATLKSDNIIIAIDGMSGSGKSVLAQYLADIFDANLFHMDDFFLQTHEKTAIRLNTIGGNVSYERFNEQVIKPLMDNASFEYEIFNCQCGTFSMSPTVNPKRINIIEGVYSFHPYFGDIYDCKILLTVDCDEQKRRILNRNGEFMLNRFLTEWIPLENLYFNAIKIVPDFLFKNGIDILN